MPPLDVIPASQRVTRGMRLLVVAVMVGALLALMIAVALGLTAFALNRAVS
jgi:hypothetical protein